MQEAVKSQKGSLMPYLTHSAALAFLISLIVLIEWATNSLRFTRLSTKFNPITPAKTLCFLLFSAIWLCQQQQSINNIKLGNTYEVECHVHASRV